MNLELFPKHTEEELFDGVYRNLIRTKLYIMIDESWKTIIASEKERQKAW